MIFECEVISLVVSLKSKKKNKMNKKKEREIKVKEREKWPKISLPIK